VNLELLIHVESGLHFAILEWKGQDSGDEFAVAAFICVTLPLLPVPHSIVLA
jgi:hypothetical protein